MIRNILNRAKHGKRKASTEKNIALKQTRAISIMYRVEIHTQMGQQLE